MHSCPSALRSRATWWWIALRGDDGSSRPQRMSIEGVHADDAATPEREHGEQRRALAPARADGAAPHEDFEGAEEADLERIAHGSRGSTRTAHSRTFQPPLRGC